jgi:hypothetical protein
MRRYPVTGSGQFVAVASAAAAAASGLVSGRDYVFASSTNCYIRQGTALKITCVAKANFADTDFITIVAGTSTVVYEFDTAGNGVTAGRVQVNISGATTAADVAVILRTAILANQTALRVVDPADGTLQVDLVDSRSLAITENVANAGFTITAGVMQASAAAGSTYVPAGTVFDLDGIRGAQLGVIRDTADGRSTVTGYTTK